MVSSAERLLGLAGRAFPSDGLSKRPSAFSRDPSVTWVMLVLVTSASGTFLNVCVLVSFVLDRKSCHLRVVPASVEHLF